MRLMNCLEARLKRLGERPERTVLRVTAEYVERLPEYSCSLPTGATIGKRWKRNVHPDCNGAAGYPEHQTKWVIGEYYDCGIPGRTGILWYEVEII